MRMKNSFNSTPNEKVKTVTIKVRSLNGEILESYHKIPLSSLSFKASLAEYASDSYQGYCRFCDDQGLFHIVIGAIISITEER